MSPNSISPENQEYNLNLLSALPLPWSAHIKLEEKPEGVEQPNIYSMCLLGYEITKGKKGLFLVDKDSSNDFNLTGQSEFAVNQLEIDHKLSKKADSFFGYENKPELRGLTAEIFSDAKLKVSNSSYVNSALSDSTCHQSRIFSTR